METKAVKVMVDQLAVEAGSLEGNVMDMSKINQNIDMVRDESLKKIKSQKIYSGKRPTRKQRKRGSSQ